MIAAQGGINQLMPIVYCLTVALVAGAGAVAVVWDRMPWWRRSPKPKRALRDARERVKIWRVMSRHPETFSAKELAQRYPETFDEGGGTP
jgi:hypothetical protein